MISAMLSAHKESYHRPNQRKGFDTYLQTILLVFILFSFRYSFTATYFQSKGDVITDLIEDMAAEQKARTTYDNILRLSDDPDVSDPIKFLRAREIAHFQRFGEGLRITQDNLNAKNFYACNPAFDKKCGRSL